MAILLPRPLTTGTFNCATTEAGWGASLGTVTRGTEVTIEGNGITQIWSGAVTATNCEERTTFVAGSGSEHNADCRSNTQAGDIFSWCAVVRFANELCPYPWRVPTQQDFIDLDIALGGDGQNRGGVSEISGSEWVTANYIETWQGAFGGRANLLGVLSRQNQFGYYWAQTIQDDMNVHVMDIQSGGTITPRGFGTLGWGFSLRCVQ